MIKFTKHTLKNGLRLLVHQDKTTPIVAFNILYNVGAKDEFENKTGFAHLFEHLMFGGSKNIPDFDSPLQKYGGTSNAFTTNDLTNYYITIPRQNLETAFWLESDRMMELAFSVKSLEVQRQVVVEEFKQRYLNQPYGDIWLNLRPLAYKVHPYKWATIGKEISHIENATMEDVKDFFYSHYAPNNAILCIAGNVDVSEMIAMTEKWFGDIDSRIIKKRTYLQEPTQLEKRILELEGDVPSNAFYKAYHMCKRTDADYYSTDLLSDVMSRGKSSPFYQILVREKKLFTDVGAFITGDIDNGLLVITGRLKKHVSFEKIEQEIDNIIQSIISKGITSETLNKVINKAQTTRLIDDMSVQNKALQLCYFELIGKAELFNEEEKKYENVSVNEIQRVAKQILQETNSSTLRYIAK